MMGDAGAKELLHLAAAIGAEVGAVMAASVTPKDADRVEVDKQGAVVVGIAEAAHHAAAEAADNIGEMILAGLAVAFGRMAWAALDRAQDGEDLPPLSKHHSGTAVRSILPLWRQAVKQASAPPEAAN